VRGDKWGIGGMKKPLSQTLGQVGERNGASPDDFTKWEVVKIANNSPQIEIKNADRVVGKKYRNDQEQ
jgi:hypothetical protein